MGWVVLLALLAFALVGGFRPIIGWLSTWVAAVLFPPAAGLPSLWPPLRFTPLGETTITLWAIDLVGVAVMLLTAWVWLRAASVRHPRPGRGRAFGRGLGVTILAVVAGNIVRGIAQSFLLHADLGTYVGQLLANIVVSALTGLALGVVVGLIAALAAEGRRSPGEDADGATDAEEAVSTGR